VSRFSDFNLLGPIQTAVQKTGYTIPTPIQVKAIPYLLQGRDLLGIAQTGTGKTAAFALPMLDHLAKNPRSLSRGLVRSLILTPTRELASQISASFATYGRDLRFRQAVIFGGVGAQKQIDAMARGVDVLVATPGRLLDLMGQGYVKLEQLEIFVLDEADRMLDMGFIHDVRRVMARLPDQRQTLLFSATMPQDIARLAGDLLSDPVRVEATPPATTVECVEQKVMFVDKTEKIHLLNALLQGPDFTSVLVFTRTKHGADKVARHLVGHDINADVIHGNKSQNARERALDGFRAGKIQVLVATDIAARGLDVPGVSHVINFDLPNEPEAYVHRIGRTARAGRSGVAISLCEATEKLYFQDIQKLVGNLIKIDTDHRFHSEAAAHAPAVKPPPKQNEYRAPRKQESRAPRQQDLRGPRQSESRAPQSQESPHPSYHQNDSFPSKPRNPDRKRYGSRRPAA
jgi:ATP-dependent RNA helicase RhlE